MVKKLLFLAGVGLVTGCQSSNSYEQAATPPPMNPPQVAYAEPPKPVPSPGPTYIPGAPYRSQQKEAPKLYGPHAGNHAYPFGPIPRTWVPATTARKWQYIVIHHSDTRTGSAAVFDRYHREVRHWNSLGYDFVIGNGTNSSDGQIEVGPRWRMQEDGAHAGVKYFNEVGIGICLVGDFQQTHPSAAQMKSLAQLTGYLMRTYHIPASRVIGHREAKDGKTNCPGRYMDLAQLKRMAVQYAGADLDDGGKVLAGTELLHDSAAQ